MAAMTATALRKAQARVDRHATERDARDNLIREAIAEGWTHARIAEATGLTRGRVNQIVRGRR